MRTNVSTSIRGLISASRWFVSACVGERGYLLELTPV